MMTYRTLLRTKVVQLLYAFDSGNEKSLSVSETELLKSIQKTKDLYFHLLYLAVLITRYAENCIEIARNKFRPSERESNPNLKFVNNLFIRQVAEDPYFTENLKEISVSWENNPEVIKSLYNDIVQSDFYDQYMANRENDFKEDKALWREIYKKIITESEILDEALEEQDIYWVDVVELVLNFVTKSIKNFKESENDAHLVPKLCKEEDNKFALELLTEVILHKSDYLDLISRLSQHWDLERIAQMDMLIMEVALAELVKFPTIPIEVTINEYIDIAKKYSTSRSPSFINGILDKAVGVLKAEKKIIKVEMPRFK